MGKLEKTSVKLVPFEASDLEEFYRIAKDEEVKRFVKILYPEDKEEAEIILEMLTEDTNYIAFKILNGKGKFTGAIIGEKKGKKTIEISYFIGAEYRGKGYCTQAVIKFKKFLKDCKYKRIEFAINPKNRKSQTIMEKLEIPLQYVSKYRIYGVNI